MTGQAVFDCLGLDLPVKLDKSGSIVRVRRLRWRLKRIRPPRDGKPLRLVFDVSNPNTFDVPIIALSGAIYVGGEAVGGDVVGESGHLREVGDVTHEGATGDHDVNARVGDVSLCDVFDLGRAGPGPGRVA